ncbi:chemotaxis protein CheX [Spirochaetota bacterium]
MDQHLNQCAMNGVKDVFRHFLKIDISKPELKVRKVKDLKQEISVVISFVGNINGVFALKCSKKFAVAAVAKMMKNVTGQSKIDKMSVTEVRDGLGEILNMVSGKIKEHFSDKDTFKISVPTIVSGKDYIIQIKANENDTTSIIHFNSELGEFFLEVFLQGK